jgi:hypothetical protein
MGPGMVLALLSPGFGESSVPVGSPETIAVGVVRALALVGVTPWNAVMRNTPRAQNSMRNAR